MVLSKNGNAARWQDYTMGVTLPGSVKIVQFVLGDTDNRNSVSIVGLGGFPRMTPPAELHPARVERDYATAVLSCQPAT